MYIKTVSVMGSSGIPEPSGNAMKWNAVQVFRSEDDGPLLEDATRSETKAATNAAMPTDATAAAAFPASPRRKCRTAGASVLPGIEAIAFAGGGTRGTVVPRVTGTRGGSCVSFGRSRFSRDSTDSNGLPTNMGVFFLADLLGGIVRFRRARDHLDQWNACTENTKAQNPKQAPKACRENGATNK